MGRPPRICICCVAALLGAWPHSDRGAGGERQRGGAVTARASLAAPRQPRGDHGPLASVRKLDHTQHLLEPPRVSMGRTHTLLLLHGKAGGCSEAVVTSKGGLQRVLLLRAPSHECFSASGAEPPEVCVEQFHRRPFFSLDCPWVGCPCPLGKPLTCSVSHHHGHYRRVLSPHLTAFTVPWHATEATASLDTYPPGRSGRPLPPPGCSLTLGLCPVLRFCTPGSNRMVRGLREFPPKGNHRPSHMLLL